MEYFKDFKNGLKINDDRNNKIEGPHWDIMTDIRKEIGGIDKIRINDDGRIINGETQIGKIKINW